MVFCPVTVLGGLPVIAQVWFSGDDGGVDALFWQRRYRGKILKGSRLSSRMMEKVENYSSYWASDVLEYASDWLGYNCPTQYNTGYNLSGGSYVEGEYSEEYKLLNPSHFRISGEIEI